MSKHEPQQKGARLRRVKRPDPEAHLGASLHFEPCATLPQVLFVPSSPPSLFCSLFLPELLLGPSLHASPRCLSTQLSPRKWGGSLKGGSFHRGVLCHGPACHLCPEEGLTFHEGAAHVTDITGVAMKGRLRAWL